MRRLLQRGAIALWLAACGDGDMFEDAAAKMEALANDVEAAGADCDKIATNIERYRALLAENSKRAWALVEEMKKEPDLEKLERLKKSSERNRERLDKATARARPTTENLAKCYEHAKTQAALKKLGSRT